MRTTGRRSVVLYILFGLFIAGIIWLVISLMMKGDKWAMQPYNGHLSTTSLGTITDSDDRILAETVDGVRIYNESETIRRALMHTVGDTNGFISTSVQSSMRSKLSGYNFITGISGTVLDSLNNNVKLTVDSDVCVAAYEALGDKNGAIMVYNYETGDVICEVSKPTFDPMNVPDDIEGNSEYSGVYLDKNLSASFPPGSIFKIVTQAAAMDKWSNDWTQRQYTCEGAVELGGSNISCLGTHGTISAYEAMGNSCNVYYAMLANDVGAELLQNKAEQMGFNSSQRFGNVDCRESTIDLSEANANQLGWAGVGQYTLLSNPYHMMVLMGAIANDGTYVEPRLAKSLDIFGLLTSSERNLMSSSEASKLDDLMRNNVENYYGDYLFPSSMQVCAKSGTAEVGNGKNPTCWFVGYSRTSAMPYAFVVVVEEGAGGIEAAGNAASYVMNAVDDNY